MYKIIPLLIFYQQQFNMYEKQFEEINNRYCFFKLAGYIRRQRILKGEFLGKYRKGLLEHRYRNLYYAESKETNIKYSWNQGYINIDNLKIAARYFLNAIDRVESLKEKYQNNLQEFELNIPIFHQLISKPFEKEVELANLKKDVSKLEREISIKIRENQLKQHNPPNETQVELKKAPVIKMDTKEQKSEKSLLPKKEITKRKERGLRV